MGLVDALVGYGHTLALLVAAAFALPLLRAFAPGERRRRVFLVVLVALHLLLVPIEIVVQGSRWHPYVRLFSSLSAAIAGVLMGGGILFSIVLPRVGLRPPRILQDLANAVAAVGVAVPVASLNGVELSSLIATSAVLTAVLGFALQDTLGNFFSGLALQLDDSIRIGDWIRVGDYTGKISSLRWRYASIETRNWETLVIPNSVLTKEHVLVLGKRSGQPAYWRRWVYFNVDFRFDPTDVIQTVTHALCAAPIENVADEPPPNCVLIDLHESYGRYAVRYWLTDLAVDDPTDSVVRTRVYFALKRVDIPLSIPAHAVFMTKETARRKEKKSTEDDEKRADLLGKLPLFAPLSRDELLHLAKHTRYAPFAKGETMTRQGAEAHWLYVIVEGEASVHVASPDGRTRRVSTLTSLDFFGEMGLMTGAPRAATVIAETDVECYRLDSQGFQAILEHRPEVAEKMADILAQRRIELATVIADLESGDHIRHSEETADLLDKIRSFFGLDG
jgi:small-conductance mechanosensitive channel/CRP-like cAMP-binding protein